MQKGFGSIFCIETSITILFVFPLHFDLASIYAFHINVNATRLLSSGVVFMVSLVNLVLVDFQEILTELI